MKNYTGYFRADSFGDFVKNFLIGFRPTVNFIAPNASTDFDVKKHPSSSNSPVFKPARKRPKAKKKHGAERVRSMLKIQKFIERDDHA